MNTFASLSPEQLRRAAKIKEQIISLEKQLAQITGGGSSSSTASTATAGKVDGRRGKRGPMSAGAKAKLAARMKAIWKARKASQDNAK